MNHKNQFLAAVLGDDGALALSKAVQRSGHLENALVPRTILSWIALASRAQYRGGIPGHPNSYVEFTKSEGGYTGQIAMGDEVYSFSDKSLYHLAASVAVSMGIDGDRVPPNMKDSDISKLGKSIDLLVRARVVTAQLLAKAESPGQPAVATAAAEPLAPAQATMQPGQPPKQKQKPKLPRVPKTKASVPTPPMLPKLKLSEAQLQKRCGECASGHMREGRFVGCVCFRDMAKSVTSVRTNDNKILLSFGSDWDTDAIHALLMSLRDDR